MMKKRVEIIAAVSVAIVSLLIIPLYSQPPQEPPDPDTSPISASLELDRGNTPPTGNKVVVADESPETGTQNPPQDSAPAEADFEPSNTADSKEILTESSTPRGTPPLHLHPSKTRRKPRCVCQRWVTPAQ